MNIIFFTKYTYAGASSRYRVYQYLPYFEKSGFNVTVSPFFTDEYLARKYNNQPISILFLASRYLNRIWNVLKLGKNSAVYIEYELLPYFPAWFEKILNWRNIKYVVDYDDAIFHNYDWKGGALTRFLFGNKIPTVMRLAKTVITGSEYLSAFAKKLNHNTVEIPTSVIYSKYEAVEPSSKSPVFTIGWIGTPSSGKNIERVLPGIARFLQQYPCRMILIGFSKTEKHIFKDLPIIIEQWHEDTEISQMKSFDVGIMPLDDTPFNRGKCGFKLIQYMACGIPTVFSPLKANTNINKNGNNLEATTPTEWFDRLEEVYLKKEYFLNVVGKDNKEIVFNHYSVEHNHEPFVGVF